MGPPPSADPPARPVRRRGKGRRYTNSPQRGGGRGHGFVGPKTKPAPPNAPPPPPPPRPPKNNRTRTRTPIHERQGVGFAPRAPTHQTPPALPARARNDVAPGQQLVEVDEAGQVRRLDRLRGPRPRGVQDRHPETGRPPGDRLADPPEADDAQGRAVDVGAEEQVRAPGPPLAGADKAVALGDPPSGGEHQGPGQIGRRLGQRARRVADRDPASSTGRDVDVVVADGVVADHPELWTGRVQQLLVDAIGEQGQDAVAAGHPAEQLIPRRRAVIGPDVGPAARLHQSKAGLGDDPRDEDPGACRLHDLGWYGHPPWNVGPLPGRARLTRPVRSIV